MLSSRRLVILSNECNTNAKNYNNSKYYRPKPAPTSDDANQDDYSLASIPPLLETYQSALDRSAVASSGAASLSAYDDGDDSVSVDDNAPVENLQARAAKETRESLAREETKYVTVLRYVVLLVLLGTTVGVSMAAFLYSRSVEQESFEAEFASVAVMILTSFANAIEHKLGAMDAVAIGITSHALLMTAMSNTTTSGGGSDSHGGFPNVTIPDFVVKAATLRIETDSIFAFWLPLVTDETRAGYEAYTQQMQGTAILPSYTMEEGLRQHQDLYFGINITETQATDAKSEEAITTRKGEQQEVAAAAAAATAVDGTGRFLHVAPPEVHPTIHEGIYGLTLRDGSWLEPKGSGPYLPMWQLSPVIPLPSIFNYNFLAYTDLAPMMLQVLDTGKAALSYLQTNHSGPNTENLIRTLMTLNQYRHQKEVNYSQKADPLTQVAYPVFDTFHPTTKQVAGMLVTTVFWRLLFANILPGRVRGVVCVLSNTLGDHVTYQLDGRHATLLGKGDLHDPTYDRMVVTRDISEYIAERASVETTSYTHVELDVGYTSYRIHVYPSQEMEDNYMTSDPLIYAAVVALIFVFTSGIFLLYDFLVERRQKKVMDKAVKSTAVVTSLFPEAVHERLFADSAHNRSEEISQEYAWKAPANNNLFKSGGGGEPPSLHDIMALRSSQNNQANHQMDRVNKTRRRRKNRPIADKFSNVTVLFADLAGFTKWSSAREPEEVFVLLETLYGAFDKVAIRRRVFKVETIGDCYMACTGLPDPQPDHAVRMVKFARDCMLRMERLLDQLQVSLGEDTGELAMRVGLHSGPVTAGVLRGDKGRFQLFGDTVNTASRMESNGIKGRIHCSDSTAKLLPAKWLTTRKDKIVAKGKGEMTTYFVEPGVEARSSVGKASSVGGDSVEMTEEEVEAALASQNSQLMASFINHANEVAKSLSFEDEIVPQQAHTRWARRCLPAQFVSSFAKAMGIEEEVEV